MKELKLYNLRVVLERFEWWKQITYNAKVGDYFDVIWENIFLPEKQGFSYYNLSSIIPLISAKQRVTNNKNDWIECDDEIRAPDYNCWAVFKIYRTGITVFDSTVLSPNINK